MSDNPQEEENLAEEVRALGKNLLSALQTAWDAPERKRVQDEVQQGLNDLAGVIRKEAEGFSSSTTGRQIRSSAEEIHERIRSSEVQIKVRQELVQALRTANNEIAKVIERWGEAGAASTPPPSGDQDTENHS